MRGYAETRHRAKSWDRQRRAIARTEATWLGLDIRFVVTNLDHGSPEWLYDSVYCARGQAEKAAQDATGFRSHILSFRHRQYRRLLVDAAVRAAVFDGFSIGSNDLTQLTLGVDRDSEIVAFDFDERDPGMLEMLRLAVAGTKRNGRHVGICGEPPAKSGDDTA